MRFLLDTHVWLWTLISPERIDQETRDLIADPDNAVLLSAASSWEMAIKYRIGKLQLPETPSRFVIPRLVRDGIEPLPVGHEHALAVADLPLHHNDPFDRLLVAQANIEHLILVTADQVLEQYEVDLRPVW